MFDTQNYNKRFIETSIIICVSKFLQTTFWLFKNNSNMTIRKKSIKALKKFDDELQLKLFIENDKDSKLIKLTELNPK